MLKSYNVHPAHDAAIAANDLRHLVRTLSDADETSPNGLGITADMLDVIADNLSRYWQMNRPRLVPDDS